MPSWVGTLGLELKEGTWVYTRSHPLGGLAVRHALSAVESKTVADFLGGLDPADPEPGLAAKARQALAAENMEPEKTPWFAPGLGGTLKLTALGKNAIPGILIGDVFGSKMAAEAQETGDSPAPGKTPPSTAKLDRLLERSKAATLDAGEAFDGASSDSPPPLYVGYGTWPDAIARGRDIQSLYHLYGWGSDRLLHLAWGPGTGGDAGIAARAAKGLLLDLPLGLMGSFGQHELGHFNAAYMAGATDVSWSHSDGSNFGGILGQTSVGNGDWDAMSPAQIMAFNAAGIFSTQASADDARLEMLIPDRVAWSHLPLMVFQKMDATVYGFITPAPGSEGEAERKWDTVQWRDNYAKRSGTPVGEVQAQLAAGAVWNMVDPMALWAAYSYIHQYIIKGREGVENPMIDMGDAQFMLGTGFWLSEVGPQYRFNILVRDPRSKGMLQMAVTGADDSQGTVETQLANIPLGGRARGRLSGGFWMQRSAAEPGAKEPGGLVGMGVDLPMTSTVSLSADLGYKSRGAVLGRDFEDGPYVSAGVKGDWH